MSIPVAVAILCAIFLYAELWPGWMPNWLAIVCGLLPITVVVSERLFPDRLEFYSCRLCGATLALVSFQTIAAGYERGNFEIAGFGIAILIFAVAIVFLDVVQDSRLLLSAWKRITLGFLFALQPTAILFSDSPNYFLALVVAASGAASVAFFSNFRHARWVAAICCLVLAGLFFHYGYAHSSIGWASAGMANLVLIGVFVCCYNTNRQVASFDEDCDDRCDAGE